MKQTHRKNRRHVPRPTQIALPNLRPTIDYRCRRCALILPSGPLPTDPDALPLYPMPDDWVLVSQLEHEGVVQGRPREAEDFCLCAECTKNVRAGYPLSLGELGAGRRP